MLGQRKNSRIFQGLKVTDILKKVLEETLGDYGRTVALKTSRDYRPLEYCTQYDETDLDFVLRLMATEGIMSYFKQGEKAEELVLFDDADKYVELVTMNHGKVPFETGVVQGQSLEAVRQFHVDTRMTQTTLSVRNFNWSRGGSPNDTSAQGKDSLQREREWYLGEAPVGLRALGSDGAYATTSAQGQVKLMQEVVRSRINRADGGGDVTGLTPGVVFDLDGALRVELNRKYLVTKTKHIGKRPGDTKEGTFAGDIGEVVYSNTFECVPSDVLFRLPSPARRFIQTMQTAVVVGNEDVTTDVHGRIKVQFHWDRQGRNDVKSSCWVRVAQSSAGIGFGHVFIPRRGQEVVISFLEGDPDKPLVIGSVHNGINSPPYELPAEKTRSVIRTRSTPDSGGYNEISFEDNKGSEELYVQAQKDMRELVKHNHRATVANNEVLRVGDDSQGGETEEGNRTRWVKNDETIDVGGNRKRTVKKDETISIDGNRTENVKLDETISVKGNRTHTVEKNDVVNVDGTHDLTVKKAITETFEDTHTCNVAKHQELSAKSKTENIKEAYELTTEKKFQVTQGGTVLELKGDKVALKAGDAIKIYHDSGAVEVTSRGDVKITGAQKITLEASGTSLTLKGGKAILSSGAVDIGN